MRFPLLGVSQAKKTTGRGQYPALLFKMENLTNDSNFFPYMTSPISLAEPRPADIQLSRELEEALKSHGCFESQAELNQRFEVLGQLDALVKTWVKDLSLLKNMPESVAERVGGKIYTFGSYRLGVHHRGADIDALCVVPKHIDRRDYFTSFVGYLRKLPEVTHLRAIEEAFVPVIKMKYDGIEIDMLFARLAEKEVSDSLELVDDKILKNLDPKCVISLNGCRVTDEILRLVPNHESFRMALRCIKVWAKKSGIYSNALGYLGGVSWAMLVARTCQLYPNAAASTIVRKFFVVFSEWTWPKPVLLKPMQIERYQQFPVWDPRTNLHDRFHVMPIITPAYPQQNSTFNISLSTRTVIQNALNLGLRVTKEITDWKATWETLFEPPNFFQQYKHFIVLVVSSNAAEDQLEWYGMVESRIRHLVGSLEKIDQIQLPHLWPISLPPVSTTPVRPSTQWFIGLQFRDPTNLKIDLTEAIAQFTSSVLNTAKSLNLHKPGMELEASYVTRKRLTDYLSPEVTGNQNQHKRVSDGEAKKRRLTSTTSVAEDSPKKPKDTEEEAVPDSLISDNSSSEALPHVEGSIEPDSGEFKSPLPVPTPNILNSGGTKEVLVLHRDLRLRYS